MLYLVLRVVCLCLWLLGAYIVLVWLFGNGFGLGGALWVFGLIIELWGLLVYEFMCLGLVDWVTCLTCLIVGLVGCLLLLFALMMRFDLVDCLWFTDFRHLMFVNIDLFVLILCGFCLFAAWDSEFICWYCCGDLHWFGDLLVFALIRFALWFLLIQIALVALHFSLGCVCCRLICVTEITGYRLLCFKIWIVLVFDIICCGNVEVVRVCLLTVWCWLLFIWCVWVWVFS